MPYTQEQQQALSQALSGEVAKPNRKKWYVYFHFTADTNQLFYVGVGHLDRAWTSANRSRFWKNKVKKHDGFISRVIASDLTIEQSHEIEKNYISIFGREAYEKNGLLVNLAEGGQGNAGFRKEYAMMPIVGFDLQGNFVKRFESITQAHREGYGSAHVRKILEFRARACKGLVFVKEAFLSCPAIKHIALKVANSKQFVSDKARSSYSKAAKLRVGDKCGQSKAVGQYDLTGNLVKRFSSMGEAAKEFGCKRDSISRYAHGTLKGTFKGYQWKFL